MKPKMCRKKKPSRGSDLAKFKATEAGGQVEGVIIGPMSSVGTVATTPQADQGNDKGIQVISGPIANGIV